MMRGGRYAVRTSLLILVVCMLLTAGDPWGGGLRVGAAASTSATVQVEYKGTYTAVFNQTESGGGNQKSVTTVTWDFVWTGTLDQLLEPFLYLKATKGNLYFAPRVLTGTTAVTYSGVKGPRDCTATLSYYPAPFPPSLIAVLVNGDSSKIAIQVSLPSSQRILRSTNPENVFAGDCNNGDYRAAGDDPHHLYVPEPAFSLLNLGKKQTQTYSGVNKEVRSGYVGSDVINSSVSLVAASCTGEGSSNVGTLLFGCYVALGDSYSAGQMPPFVPGGDACLRSTRAYAYLYDKNVAFAACSGSTIATVRSTQLLFVQTTTKLVTITIGGNDIGIFGMLTQCLFNEYTLSRCENAFPPPDYASLHARLVSLYGEIHSRAPGARIFVLGYPVALPPAVSSRCPGLFVGYTRIGVTSSDVPYFYKLLTKMNDTIHRATQDSGVATFVSPDLFFAGHDVCSTSSSFFPLDVLNRAQSLHPNAEGHAELASLVRRAAGPPPD